MAAGSPRLSLLLDPALLDATKALVASRKENPDVPWTTLTEVVTWGLQKAPAEVERRRKTREKEAQNALVPPPAFMTELPFRVYFRQDARPSTRGMWGQGMLLPDSPQEVLKEIVEGVFHRTGLVEMECLAEGITRFLGVRVETISGAPLQIAVQEMRDQESPPEPKQGTATLVYLDVGGSPNLLDREKIAADVPLGVHPAVSAAMLHPAAGTTYALKNYPILIPPNNARLDLVVHPDDGPLRVFLLVERLR